MDAYAARQSLRAVGLFVSLWGIGILANDSGAQTYPNRPIRWIVPYIAGSSPDVVGRIVSPKISERLGQSVVIDNRGGANSIIGTELAVRAPADGYTVLLGATALAINPSMYKLSYDAAKSFTPVTQTVAVHFLLVVHPSLPVKTTADFITFAKARSGQLTYGSAGTGSPGHLAGELLQKQTGIKLLYVSYKGGPQAMADLIGGQIQMQFDVIATSLPHIKAGKTRALAVSSAQRSTILPDMPTVAETVPGFNMVGWQGFLVPTGTPSEIIQRLHREIAAVFALPEVRQRMFELGYETVASSPQEFAEFMRTNTAQFAKIISGAGIRPE
ncbi:MAG TPA: tripartite tricarboxylate transporter substrate binding protein [Burkholderiales bacterium]|nr:tripartite tricarboxylate transporter substrate binding protein [Burkholderiales bacterium]